MKQSLLCLAILYFLVGVSSCKKDKNPIIDNQVIKVTIHSSEDYYYDLGSYGKQERASITRQATHYQLSSMLRDSNSLNITYKYKPAQGYVGTDEVEIKSEKSSDGSTANDIVILTTIKFTVNN